MKIFLAELSHTGAGRSPNVVPLAAGYLAAYLGKVRPEDEVEIFRDPTALLDAVRTAAPEIVGFSAYDWSERLAAFCARKVKELSPSTVTVAGGASIDDIDDELVTYLAAHPEYDACVPNEGELALANLAHHVAEHGGLQRDAAVGGCARLGADGALVRGAPCGPDVSELPSPYLEGLLDPFLAEGYEPVLQSMRGCPYRCTFCVSGTANWSKLRGFDLSRVFAEFEYIRDRTTTDILILTDENLGILRERDVELAEFIAASHEETGYPARLYFYAAKLVTEHVLAAVEALAPIAEFGVSFQTMDPAVRQEIKRTNTRWPQFLEYVDWARSRGIQSSTELIFGLPGESASGYVAGIEELLRSGVDRIYSYNLRLLSGIDIATRASREQYGFDTRFRLPGRNYGVYRGEVVHEVEEVVVGSASFDFDDYLFVRRYGLFLELVSGRGYLSELVNLMVRLGLPGEKLVGHLAGYEFAPGSNARAVVDDYDRRAVEELHGSVDECTAAVRRLIEMPEGGRETKINYVFVGKLMLDPATRREVFGAVGRFVDQCSTDDALRELLSDYVENLALGRVVSFAADEAEAVTIASRVDPATVATGRTLDELALPEPAEVVLRLHRDAVQFIERSPVAGPHDEARIQDLYMNVSRFGLVRTAARPASGPLSGLAATAT